MRNQTLYIAAISTSILATLALTGCSSTPTETPNTVGVMNQQVIAPITVNLSDIQNADIEVTSGNTINLNVQDGTETGWKADIKDNKIVEYTPGTDKDGVTTNPSLKALNKGTTKVKIYNDVNDVTFTVIVK